MTAIADLNTAIDTLSISISTEIEALKTALTFVGQDAAIEASVARLTVLNDSLKASASPVVATPAPDPVVVV